MKTAQEIEAELGQAADRMRLVSKAAKDQAARQSGEPVDVATPNLGDTIPAPGATIQTQR